MKNNKMVTKKSAYMFLFLALLSISVVLAIHVVTTSDGGTSFSVNETVNYTYNITLNNSDLGNVSQINITIPSNFTFTANTNGTNISVSHNFTNTSTILTWANITEHLLNGTEIGYFWFNASCTNPGTYNFTIEALNSTNTSITNISVTINDTTAPQIQFVDGTDTNLSNLSRTYINYNVTATDTIALDTINISLWNYTMDWINSTTNTTSAATGNFAGLSAGTYYLNATVNDSAGNSNSSLTRTIVIDTTAGPVVTSYLPADATSAVTTAYNFTFNVTDVNNTVVACELFLNGAHYSNLTTPSETATNGIYNSSIPVGSYTWLIGCADNSGNLGNSSSKTLVITSSDTSSTSSSSSSSSSSTPLESQLEIGYRRENLYQNYKVSLSVKSIVHMLKIIEVNSTSLKIRIESDPQEATLTVGEDAKFDLDADNIYDLLVTLDNINQIAGRIPSVDITIKTISEEIVLDPGISPAATGNAIDDAGSDDTTATGGEVGDDGSKSFWWIVGIVIVLILLVAYIIYMKKFRP